MADKDFRVKNKLHVNGLNNASGVILATNNALDSHTTLPTQYGGTGTTTSPTSGQILYSSAGTTYSPTTLSSLVTPVTYSADAPASPVTGQIWVESDSATTAFDPNIVKRQSFTATAAQTVFTTSHTWIEGYEQVYLNGLLLLRTTDYTTSNTNTVTLVEAAAVNDILEVVTVTNFNVNVSGYTQDAAPSSATDGQIWLDTDGTLADAAFIPNTLTTTTGDIIYASAANTPARRGIGTSGQVLTVSGGVPTWATPAAGSPITIPRLSASYYLFGQGGVTTTTATLNQNSWFPIYLPVCTVDRIATRTASTFSGTSLVRLGIYNNGANNVPTTVLLDAGTVSCTAASTVYEITVNQSISTAGWYWLVFRTVTAATTNTYAAVSGSTGLPFQQASSTLGINEPNERTLGFRESSVTGSFATAGTLSEATVNGSGQQPTVSVRIN
jgi:hypothetical protein